MTGGPDLAPVPRPALILGLAGLIPFAWGAATVLDPALAALVPARLAGRALLIGYGTIILCFMSGVLWGFAAKGAERAWRGYAASVVPALWALFMVTGPEAQALSALLTGFFALLALDAQFALWRLVPRWWMRLRFLLTAGVAVCLGVGLWLG